MEEEDGKRRKSGGRRRRFSGLEKGLALLFLAMTGACVGLVVVYLTGEDEASGGGGAGETPDSGCGGPRDLTGESGVFTSRNYPGSYDNGKSCAWHITVDPSKVIHLWFEDFSVEETALCTADIVTLSDALGVIGRFCGQSKPRPMVSLGNKLVVFFDTNERNTDKGFKAHFRAVPESSAAEIAGAGGSVHGERGDLLTPGFPEQNYENGALYQWRISVPERAERVRLTFTSFDLIPDLCGDHVDVYDGHSAGAALLDRFCGGSLPKPVESTGNTMVVRFKSDARLTSKGFSATYTKTSLPPVVVPTTPRPPTTTKTPITVPTTTTVMPTTPALESGCGGPGTLHGRKGVIHSLGYPAPYPGGLRCSWNITVAEGNHVMLRVTDMAVTGEAGQCKEDKLVAADNLQTLGTFCGYVLPPVVVSSDNRMSISFLSDGRLSDPGFSARWEEVHPEDIAEIQGCGGWSGEETGVVKTQGWPGNYRASSECMWGVQAPPGKNITLTFTHFDLEAKDFITSRCYDNVVVYDLHDGGADRKGPWCGTTLPPSVQTRGSRLLVRFHSDFFTEATGFRAYWTTDASLPPPTDAPVPPNPWDNIPIDWPIATCGRPAVPPTVHTRIVNGEPATPHSWPWQVSMQVWPPSRPEPSFSHICGGTLIHKNWVMTAAHCFINYADELQRWRMCLGKHNLTFAEPSERCLPITAIHRHEGFRYPTVPTVEFDVALVRLDGEATPTDQVSFACLPRPEEVLPAGRKCYASGWGDETGDSLNAKPSEGLNQVALPVIPFDTCKRMDYWWFQVKTSMICCGYTLPDELKSVCQGDSGGPLVCRDSPSGPWEVHGITSFGPIGCIMDKKPSVFTRASAYVPWMENVIRRDLYTLHTSGCGGPKDVTGDSGALSSMGHPGSYSNGARCQWNIQVPPGMLVHLQFHSFSLEESQLCMNDKVTLTDRMGSLGTHCSHAPPRDLVSDGERLSISFTSNNRVVDTGFRASWRAVRPSQAPCGGTFSSAQGTLTSPNWPEVYPDRAACTWRVTVPAAENITVAITHFELQAVSVLGLCLDYVEVFGGPNMTSLGRFCGFGLPPPITVPGNTAVIRFLSNGADAEKGFRGYWTTDAGVVPTLPPAPPNPWDNITIAWSDQCGSPAVPPSTDTMRVVNGVEAVPHSWPWQVSMQASPFSPIPHMHACGGSLIHQEWVLTAAHCFMKPFNAPRFWRMCLGKHHMNSSLDVPSAEACHAVDAVIGHPGFVYETDRSDITNDIALVHLATPVNVSREVSPVCLPARGEVMPAGTPCFVTGWGDEKGNLFPKVSEHLNQAALPVIDFPTCSKPGYWWDTVRPSMVCAGYETPDELKSACQGDSGGPFACKPAGVNSTWQVHGIVSFGPQGCIKDKKPSVFTRVSAFSDWILDNMRRFIYENARSG